MLKKKGGGGGLEVNPSEKNKHTRLSTSLVNKTNNYQKKEEMIQSDLIRRKCY